MPEIGRAPSASSGGAPPLCQRSAAETSGAPGGVSSKRSVTGGAYGPTLPAASSSATRTAYSPGPSAAVTATVPAGDEAAADEAARGSVHPGPVPARVGGAQPQRVRPVGPRARIERRPDRPVRTRHRPGVVAAPRLVVHRAPVQLDAPGADPAVVTGVERDIGH